MDIGIKMQENRDYRLGEYELDSVLNEVKTTIEINFDSAVRIA